MKTYCYIRNGELTETSDSLIAKAKPAVFVEDGESGVQVLMEEAVEGMVYDEVIETKLEWRVCYEGGRIVAWENSEEKALEDAKIAEELAKVAAEYKNRRLQDIPVEIGRLQAAKEGFIILEQPIEELQVQIDSLISEYHSYENNNL